MHVFRQRNKILLYKLMLLKRADCDHIFQDKASGSTTQRAGLNSALAYVRKGDTLVVWRLDRLGRSLKHLIETIAQLDGKGIGFHSLQEAIDTTTSGGRLIFQIFGALAEFERKLIQERTRAGLNAARTRERIGGRPKILDENKISLMLQLYDEKKHTIKEICSVLNISKPTLYVYLRQRK